MLRRREMRPSILANSGKALFVKELKFSLPLTILFWPQCQPSSIMFNLSMAGLLQTSVNWVLRRVNYCACLCLWCTEVRVGVGEISRCSQTHVPFLKKSLVWPSQYKTPHTFHYTQLFQKKKKMLVYSHRLQKGLYTQASTNSFDPLYLLFNY